MTLRAPTGFTLQDLFSIAILLFPLVMFSLGISMLPTSPGMFLCDAGDSIGIVTTAMLLLPWIFYPLAACSLAAFGVVWAGSVWFQKTRKCFADVL